MDTGNGPRRIGKYELHELLGHGGMAEVWKAWDNHLGRYVAIKILHTDLQNDADFMKRFIREAQVVASLHHPNIIKIHDFQISSPPESERTIAYMVMDYVEGETLADYIRTTSHTAKFPSAANIVYLFTFISKAIDYAHQRGMIHRDIKPANILLDRRLSKDYVGIYNPIGEPILTDFGIVKLLSAPTATLTGSWLGTPMYISPEQAQGHSGNERSDIYSLGVILYEICTGVRPFIGENTFAIIMQHIQTMPTPPALINPNISPALSDVILCSLAKDPMARFASASAMVEALVQAFNISTPEGVRSPTHATDIMSNLVHRSTSQANGPLSETPSSPSSPPPAVLSTPKFLDVDSTAWHAGGDIAWSKQGTSSPGTTPINNTSEAHQINRMVQNATDITPAHPPGTETSVISHKTRLPKPISDRRRRGVLIGLLVALIIVLLSAGLATFYLNSHQNSPGTANQIVGHAFFISDGRLNENTTLGLNDKLEIDLLHIPALPSAKSYYAWLLSDKNKIPVVSLLLGKLQINSGTVSYVYPGEQQQTDLLVTYSRLLITEEDSNSAPSHPSTDQSTWRYYAELPQTPRATDKTTALDYLRFLLSEDLLLAQLNIHGGLNVQLYKHMQQVVGWVDSASTSEDPAFIHRQVISILDYLDGATSVQKDVPRGTALLASSQVPMIAIEGSSQTSYVDGISGRLKTLEYFPDITQDMSARANQIDAALTNNVQNWLDHVRQYAKQLVNMKDSQLLLPSSKSILIDMQTQAQNALFGTDKEQEGIRKIYADVQHLATFNIALYNKPYL